MLSDIVVDKLKSKGIPINKHLPSISTLHNRSAKDVAIRCNVLGVLLAISDDTSSISFFNDLLLSQGMFKNLSNYEKSLFDKDSISNQEVIDLSWSQESLYALSWCMGLIPNMNFPTTEATLDDVFSSLPPETDLDGFIESAQLIDSSKIMQELEFYYGLHWAIRHPEAWSLRSKFLLFKKLNISIIRERRKALEWVVDLSLDWDEISLDT